MAAKEAGPWDDYAPAAAPDITDGPWNDFKAGTGASSTARRVVGDSLVTAAKIPIGTAETLTGLADIGTMGAVGKAMQDHGVDFRRAKEIVGDLYSPEQKNANRAVDAADGFAPTVVAMAQNPSTIYHGALESAGTFLTGGGVARGVIRAGVPLLERRAIAALPAAEQAAARAAASSVNPIAASALGEGATVAGQNTEQIREESKDGLVTPSQVALQVGAGGITSLIGNLVGKVANKAGIGHLETMLATGRLGPVGEEAIAAGANKGIARKFGEGALIGAAQEAPQSYQEQIAQNLAQDKPWDEGAGKAAAQGMMAGALMEAAPATLSSRAHATAATTPTDSAPAGAPIVPVAPVSAPGDPLRAIKVEESGPLGRVVNLGVEQEAQAADAGNPVATPIAAALAGVPAVDAPHPDTPRAKADETTVDASTTPGVGSVATEQTAAAMPTDEPTFDPSTGEIKAPQRATFPSAEAVDEYLSQQRLNGGGTRTGKAARVALADGSFSFVREGEPGFEEAAAAAKPRTGLQQRREAARLERSTASLAGAPIENGWTAFSKESGTKGVPRVDMPQIKAEHRGAMVNFLNARGIAHEQVEIPASDLKPTQAEFSPAKVEKAKGYADTDRSILVSSDGHVLDGHHQWLAKAAADEPIKAIRLNAPIKKLLAEVKEFPSATRADVVTEAPKNLLRLNRDWAAAVKAGDLEGAKMINAQIVAAKAAAQAAPVKEATQEFSQAPAAEPIVKAQNLAQRREQAQAETSQAAPASAEPAPAPKTLAERRDATKKVLAPTVAQRRAAEAETKRAAAPQAIESNVSDAAFSRRPGFSRGVPMADAKAVVATLRAAMPTAPPITLHESISNAPKALRDIMRRAGVEHDAEAAYHDGEIHVFPKHIESIERMQFLVAHHEIRHHGLRSMLGPNMGSTMLALWSNPSLRAAAQAKIESGHANTRVLAVEEALADMPTEDVAKLKGFDKLVSGIRQWLRRVASNLRRAGLSSLADMIAPASWTDNDVAALVQRAEGVSKGGKALFRTGGTVFGRDEGAQFSRIGDAAAKVADRFNAGEVIAGRTNREYTPAQLESMRSVGFAVTAPTIQERVAALWKDAGKKVAQGIVDQFAPVKDIDAKAYNLLRLSKGASGAFQAFLQGGKLRLTDGVYDFDESKRGGVVNKLLIPLQGEHHDFFRWVAANRAERLMGEGKENLFKPEDIAALKSLADGTANFDYTVQTGVQKGLVTRDRTKIYGDALRVFNEFHSNVLDMAEQSGLIDGEARKLWEQDFYVPFYRVEDDGSIAGASIKNGAVRQQAFKSLTGRTEKLNADLLDNTLMNWAHLLDAAAKNRAAKASIEAAELMGSAAKIDGPSGKGTVWFREGGDKRYSVVADPYLLTAISSLEYAGMNSPIMKAMGFFKHALTTGVTASPFFKIRNLIRDSVQVIGTSSIGVNPVSNIASGWKLTSKDSDSYFRLLAGGGTIHFGTMLEGSEAKRVQSLVDAGVDASTILDSDHKMKAFYRKFIAPGVHAYNELGERGEAINRAALYDQLVKQGMSHADASLQARDLMDFSMQGSFTTIRFLTQVVPFFNARIQGLYKLGRAAKEDPKRFSAVIGAAALLSIGLLAAGSDDDDWKKREDWDRNNYWWFKFGGTAFRIPKPFEIGAIATLAERGFELAFDKEMTNKRFMAQVMTLLGDNLSMNPVPQMVKPIIDVYSNKDSFTGRPIESMGMEKLQSAYRFNSRTSMAARAASTAANAVTGLVGVDAPSPVQIDHMLQGYFGWLGAFVVNAGDVLARPATGQADRATPDMMKTITGGMASDLRDQPSRYVSQMYTQAKEIEQAYGTMRALRKQGKVEEAMEFAAAHAGEISMYKNVERVKRTESKLGAAIRQVESSDRSSEEKRDMIRNLRDAQDRAARSLAPLF